MLSLSPLPADLGLTRLAEKRCPEGDQLLLYRRPAADRSAAGNWLELTADSQFDWLSELQSRLAEKDGNAVDR